MRTLFHRHGTPIGGLCILLAALTTACGTPTNNNGPDGATALPDGTTFLPDTATALPDVLSVVDVPPMDTAIGCGSAADCNDGIACTDDTCVTGTCIHTPNAAHCDDHIACTDDACTGGACVHTPVPARCMVGQLCDPTMGCQGGRACATTADCADTNPCTVNERCDPATRICASDTLDGDMDGYPPRVCGGGDCDDSNAMVHPGATEICNGIDDNCNSLVDEPPAGAECGTGFICRDAMCACVAPTPMACYRSCVDPMTDAQNCGGCGNPCGTTGTCVAGVCQCPTGVTVCSRIGCTDLRTDPANCGTCGNVCPGTATCVAGACRCPGIQTLCGRACVDTTTDSTNCGTCGNVCPGMETCVGGACRCPGTQTFCGGMCVATATFQMDNANCGGCGMACRVGTLCVTGVCIALTTTGTLAGTAQNFQDHTGLGGLTVTTCAATDVSCATPLATATTTTGTGAFTITYPLTAGAFNGYFQFTGGSGASHVTPTRTFLTLTGATSTQTFSLVPLAVFTGLSSLFPGVQFDSTHGAVTFAVQTAAGAAISGADVAASPSAGTPFYIAFGLPSETATQTDSSGEGGFFSTAPGNYTFTAASADGGTIGSESSSVRGGYITAFTIYGSM